MNQAASGDFQGAIWSAISAKDMAQAEIWLRAALDRFPSDPNVLSLAARFEQARGNKQRAAEFWRAAIAAAPSRSSTENPGGNASYPSSSASNPGDIERLLNPNLDPGLSAEPSPDQLAPLPSYKSQSPQASVPPLPSTTETASPRPPTIRCRSHSRRAMNRRSRELSRPRRPFLYRRAAPATTAHRTRRLRHSPAASNSRPLGDTTTPLGDTDAEVQTGITGSTQPTTDALRVFTRFAARRSPHQPRTHERARRSGSGPLRCPT